jgi:hypothetical protein
MTRRKDEPGTTKVVDQNFTRGCSPLAHEHHDVTRIVQDGMSESIKYFLKPMKYTFAFYQKLQMAIADLK